MISVESASRSKSLVEHDLFGKPVSIHRVKPGGMLFRIIPRAPRTCHGPVYEKDLRSERSEPQGCLDQNAGLQQIGEADPMKHLRTQAVEHGEADIGAIFGR